MGLAAKMTSPATSVEMPGSRQASAGIDRGIEAPAGLHAERVWAASVQVEPIDWLRCVPFILMHLACLLVLWVGVSWVPVGVAAALFVARMFFVTAFYHRYFSHRTFRTSRWFQGVMACLACTSGQRGPLWWAAHHRRHHTHSDKAADPHSPRVVGFMHSHMGWFMTKSGFLTQRRYVRDWERYPELRLLNRYDWVPLAALGVLLFALGATLDAFAPGWNTDGWQLLVWGLFVSTIALYHSTYTINSVAHRLGSRRFNTDDDSRNNFVLAVLTLGEGWHNNHHHYPASVRQGFYWWEIDPTYYGLKVLSWLGLIWDLKPVPPEVLRRNRIAGNGAAPIERGAA